jgi:hypothetical protein
MGRLLAVLLVALVAAGAASAATPKPSAHDRALVRRIEAQSETFAKLASQTKSEESALVKCNFAKKNPAQAFAAAIAVLPALLIQIVTEYKPQFLQLRDLLASMHPDSPLFAQWLGDERQSFALLLQFDNGGKPIDLCKAGEVMLSKKSTAADVKAVLGIDPAVVSKLFQGSQTSLDKKLTRIKPKMRSFFVAAGLSPARAKALTT